MLGGGVGATLDQRGQTQKHKCRAGKERVDTDEDSRSPEERSSSDSGNEFEGGSGFEDRPWPKDVAYPPEGILHPFDYTSTTRLVKKVPEMCQAAWARQVRDKTRELADAVTQGVDSDIAVALDRWLRLPQALKKKVGKN